eukprot:5745202-Pyramimonas_sp.AAC.1
MRTRTKRRKTNGEEGKRSEAPPSAFGHGAGGGRSPGRGGRSPQRQASARRHEVGRTRAHPSPGEITSMGKMQCPPVGVISNNYLSELGVRHGSVVGASRAGAPSLALL